MIGLLLLLTLPSCVTGEACASEVDMATSCPDVVTLRGDTYNVEGDCLKPEAIGDPVILDPEDEVRFGYSLKGIPTGEAIGVDEGADCPTLAWNASLPHARLLEIEQLTLTKLPPSPGANASTS
jgi:hypothetical protein